jgi:DNA-binding transcriptional MerR regulator
MKMRDLEAQTGVNRESIRVYFRHGLLPEPHRPKPNVADYDETHVRAIQAVRGLQRDHGLTIRQIQKVLTGRAMERRVEAAAFRNLEDLVAARMKQTGGPILISGLIAEWPHAASDAEELEKIGLAKIVRTRKGAALSVTDAQLVTIWGQMRLAGFTEELDFSPSILAFYAEPADEIAAAEAERFLERTEGKLDEERAAEMLQAALGLMLTFFGLIRMKAFLSRIHRGPGLTRDGAAGAE